MSKFECSSQGEKAVRICFGDAVRCEVQAAIQSFVTSLESQPLPGVVNIIPGFVTLTVCYEPALLLRACADKDLASPYQLMVELLTQRRQTLSQTAAPTPRLVEVPVCYGGPHGPDLDCVAEHCRLRADEVVELHSAAEYSVFMIGFSPGFPFLGGLPERLITPRRDQPRSIVPAGSVGIGGAQTGVYPMSGPGGWQLIGRTALPFFQPEKDPPCLLRAGDLLKFYPISASEYQHQLRQHGQQLLDRQKEHHG